MIIEDEIWKGIFPKAPIAHILSLIEHHEEVFLAHKINTRDRQAFFLAQLGHESAGLTQLEENLNYSAERLMQVWPRRFPNMRVAGAYAHDSRALANLVYANRMGNGDVDSGDGYTYRGRGYIQITGRSMYQRIGRHVGLDLLGEPELAKEPETALLVAAGYWSKEALHVYADTKDFVGLTKAINGGTNGLEDRKLWLMKVQRALRRLPA